MKMKFKTTKDNISEINDCISYIEGKLSDFEYKEYILIIYK